MRHYKIKIYGKVQGVSFRSSTLRRAQKLGVVGFVRNEDDGSVYCEAEAIKEIMDEFLLWCNDGPENALVDDIRLTEGAIFGFDDFNRLN